DHLGGADPSLLRRRRDLEAAQSKGLLAAPGARRRPPRARRGCVMRASCRAVVALLVLCCVTGVRDARADEPPLAPPRIVLHTTLGDLVLALYPTVAPKHVEQVLRLVRLGVYDGTFFYRVDPSFLAQISTAQTRPQPLTPEQAAAIHPLPAEFSDL